MVQPTNEIVNVVRPLANFQPGIWNDFFCEFTPIDEATQNEMEQSVRKLREEVRRELLAYAKDKKEAIVLIDAIQKLGVAHHFEEEIKALLQEFHKDYDNDSLNDDLIYASLLFRLLREQGLFVSCDVFDKFKGENGCFKESLKTDVEGMINLYEASHMRLRDEKVLEEALVFTTNHLTLLASTASSPVIAEQVAHALKRPLAKSTKRLEAVYQFSVYKSDASYYEALLKLAKMDFNLLQQLHKKEVSDLIRWSRSLDLAAKFPFSRDRIVEAYMWTLGVYYEPKFSCARTKLNKVFAIITKIDDIYDAYGTIEELELFTKAILRWDRNYNELPDYMKLALELVYDTFQEFEEHFAQEEKPYAAVEYLQNEFKASCQAYLVEARWCHQKYIPTYDEYMKNATVSSVYHLMLIAAYQGTDVNVTRDAVEWMHQNPKAIEASCIVARLLDDMAGYKFDKQRDHVASAMDCLMENSGISEDKAYEELSQKTEEAWMDLRATMFRQPVVPHAVLTLLNMCRVMNDVYQFGEDSYTECKYMIPKVQALLVEPAIV